MKTSLIALLVSLCLLAGTASAEFGIGASVGYVTLEDSAEDLEFEGTDTGYKVFANWMFNDYIGIEGGFVDFGAPDDDIEDLLSEIDANGWNAYIVGNIPLGDYFDIFAKVGAIGWEADTSIEGVLVGTDDGTDLAASVGLRLNLGDHFGIRGELDWYDVSEADTAWMAGVGIEFRF